jgi:hypothetical protein
LNAEITGGSQVTARARPRFLMSRCVTRGE